MRIGVGMVERDVGSERVDELGGEGRNVRELRVVESGFIRGSPDSVLCNLNSMIRLKDHIGLKYIRQTQTHNKNNRPIKMAQAYKK
jgi:hypothetical protein